MPEKNASNDIPPTVGETSSQTIASNLDDEYLAEKKGFKLRKQKKEIQDHNNNRVLKLQSNKLRGTEYTLIDRTRNDLFQIRKDGLIGGDYTVYDHSTDEPVAVFDEKALSFGNRAWHIKDPETGDTIYKLNTESTIRDIIVNAPTIFSIFYTPSMRTTVTNVEGEEVAAENKQRSIILLNADVYRDIEITPNTVAADLVLTLFLLSLYKA